MIAIVKPEGIYWSSPAPHYCGLFNTAESAGEHAILNGADAFVVA